MKALLWQQNACVTQLLEKQNDREEICLINSETFKTINGKPVKAAPSDET